MKKFFLLSIVALFAITVASNFEAYTEKKSADIALVSESSPASFDAIIGDAELPTGIKLVRHEAGAGWWSVLLIAGAFAGSRMKPKREIWGAMALAGFAFAIGFVTSLFSSAVEGIAMAGMTILPAILTGPDGQQIPPLTRAQKKLYDYQRMKGNVITLDALANGALKWDNITYYVRKALNALSNRTPVLNASIVESLGICNLDKGQLPQYYNFCYDRIEIGFGSTNTASASPAAIAGYSSVLSSMDPSLRNGELIVVLNKNVQIESPVTDFGSKAAVTGGGALNFDGGELADPQVWVEQQQIEIDINLTATAVANTVNTTFAAEFLFKGVQARLR